MFRLFCSHSHEFAGQLAEIKARLAGDSIDAFVAHTDIEPSAAWMDVIETALATCDAQAVFLTDRFHASRYTDQEVGWCIGRGILVLPVMLAAAPYGLMGKWQAIPGHVPSLAETLAATLHRNELSRGRMAEVAVERFEASDSFEAARANMGRLNQIPVEAWTDALLARVARASADNGELKNAWFGRATVPAAVGALVKRVQRSREHFEQRPDREGGDRREPRHRKPPGRQWAAAAGHVGP